MDGKVHKIEFLILGKNGTFSSFVYTGGSSK